MESLTGETQKKRVVRSSAYMHEKTLTPAINCYSATFLIRTSEGFIMVRVIRQCLEMPDGYVTDWIYIQDEAYQSPNVPCTGDELWPL